MYWLPGQKFQNIMGQTDFIARFARGNNSIFKLKNGAILICIKINVTALDLLRVCLNQYIYFFGLSQYLMQDRLFSCSASCPWSPFSNMFQRISTERNRSWPVGSGSIKREQTVVAASALSIWSQFLAVIQIISLNYSIPSYSFSFLYYIFNYMIATAGKSIFFFIIVCFSIREFFCCNKLYFHLKIFFIIFLSTV